MRVHRRPHPAAAMEPDQHRQHAGRRGRCSRHKTRRPRAEIHKSSVISIAGPPRAQLICSASFTARWRSSGSATSTGGNREAAASIAARAARISGSQRGSSLMIDLLCVAFAHTGVAGIRRASGEQASGDPGLRYMLQRNMTFFRPIGSGRFRPESCSAPPRSPSSAPARRRAARSSANMLAAGFQGAILPVGAEAARDLRRARLSRYRRRCRWRPTSRCCATERCRWSPAFEALAREGHACRRGDLHHAAAARGRAQDRRARARPRLVRRGGARDRAERLARPPHAARPARSRWCRNPRRCAARCWTGREPNGVGFSHIIGIGGNGDIGFGIVLDWLARDPGTGAILLDIRRIRDRRAFLSAARAAARLRPMVAIRAGGLLLDPTGDADAALSRGAAALRRAGGAAAGGSAGGGGNPHPRPAGARRGAGHRHQRHRSRPAGRRRGAARRPAAGGAERGNPQDHQPERAAAPSPPAPRPASPRARRADDIVYVGPTSRSSWRKPPRCWPARREVGGVLVVHAPTGAGGLGRHQPPSPRRPAR